MSEQYISLAEVRDLLTAENEKRGELSTIQRAAMSHAQTIAKLSLEQTRALIAEVSALSFTTESASYKIADLLPKYPEDIRAIFAKERITLEADNVNKIIEIVDKYL
ncbi:MAG: RNA polymerase Rpb4 family protein [Candidatus Methanomethylophilaceae archaeon]|jgi:DNA-directed RNA polymerase subunit F